MRPGGNGSTGLAGKRNVALLLHVQRYIPKENSLGEPARESLMGLNGMGKEECKDFPPSHLCYEQNKAGTALCSGE